MGGETQTSEGQGERAVQSALEAYRQGRMVLISDSERPERGAIVAACGERTNEDVVNFMATWARGLIALGMLSDRMERLGLELQGPFVQGVERENYAVSVEAREGVSTGISAADRATTIMAACDPRARSEDLVTPGHVFPVLSDRRGVVIRPGWAEAALDVARIAGMRPVATFSQVLDDDGEIMTGDALDAFAEAHALPHVTIAEIVDHRMASESFVNMLTQSTLSTRFGEFLVRVFANELDDRQHLAITLGELRSPEPVLTRVHSECLTGDVFGSMRCDCGPQLDTALRRISEEGRGVVLYLRQEGRGIGLVNKIRAYGLQDSGRDTVEANLDLGFPADKRDFGIGAQMLLALGVRRVRLMTNNPRKVKAMARLGIEVTAREPIEIDPSPHTERYLSTKKAKLGHLLTKV